MLVPEPARPDGGVVTGRYAIARFNLRTTGRPCHAGARLAEGRSAIREMCEQIVAIEEMTTDDCTFSVGVIHGGQWVNCVATTCDAEALSMAKRQEDLDAGVERMLACDPARNDVVLEVTRGVTRPVWEPDAKGMALYAHARGIAQPHRLRHHRTRAAAAGRTATSPARWASRRWTGSACRARWRIRSRSTSLVDSLVPRARLMAGLLASLE